MITNEKTVEILNDLVKINNDRIAGYERALKETDLKDADLKVLFTNMLQESRHYKQALATEVIQLGGEVESGTSVSGKIYRTWMDVKATFTGNDRKVILSNCEFGEDAAQKAYLEALQSDDLPAYIRELVRNQKENQKSSHDKIKNMRDSL